MSDCYKIINPQQIYIFIVVQPNSKKNEFYTLYDNKLKIKINSPPVDGKANDCVIAFLADHFKIKKNQVTITKGLTERQKTILLSEVDSSKIKEKIDDILKDIKF